MNYREKIYSSYLTNRCEPSRPANLESVTVWYEKEILPILPREKNIKILELGCGQGYFLHVLNNKGYNNLTGVDLGEEQLDAAGKLGVRQFIIQADVFSFLKDSKEIYNIICAFDLLEHFYKDELMELLELIQMRLKSGGLFIFRVPNGEALFPGRIRYGDITHELAFTRNSMAQVLKASGFSACDCYPVKPVVHGVKILGRRIIFEVFEKIFQVYLIAETGGVGGYILTQNLWGRATK